MLIINKDVLHEMYIDRGMTDKEIALELNVDRTYVSKLRKKYFIETRKSTGLIGEEFVSKKFKEMDLSFSNMNEISMTYPFDFLINESKRIEVKSAKKTKNGRFYFALSEKPANHNIVSENRIILSNKRTKKLFQKTCDFIIFVCLEEIEEPSFYIMPSDYLDDKMQNLALTPTSKSSKYNIYKDNWGLLT